jgi:hypothetical protein
MPQQYEDYWKITLEYSDVNGERFRGTLKIIVNFIDRNKGKPFSSELFNELQEEVDKSYHKVDMASVRKSINQFVKLGFINYHLESYHEDTPAFLEANTNRRRNSIFSKIVYTNSSFNRSVTNNSDKHEINFLIKTLEEVGKLSKEDISALMTINIETINKGYLTQEELTSAKEEAERIRFLERKYNQAGHLNTILQRLDDLIFVKREGYWYFKEDALDQFGDYLRERDHKRDYYLYRIYKNQLKEESNEKLGDIKCMLEELNYPSLVASHLKPFIMSNKTEAYDSNNGLLLSRNMDILLDLGYISFEDNGKILLSKELSKDVKEYLNNYSLKNIFLNDKRLIYLRYHRKKVFRG